MLGDTIVLNIYEFGIHTYDRQDQAFLDGIACMGFTNDILLRIYVQHRHGRY